MPQPRGAGRGDGDEQPLLFTSLRSAPPKVLLNTDIGDRAVIGTRRCDCLYDRLGCRLTFHNIRSSDKVAEFGVTFAVSDIFHVLEEVLPRRFGGCPGDYQLVESRDSQGLPRYTLIVNANLLGINDRELPAAFLAEMSKLQGYYRFMAAAWKREGLIHVQRGSPLATPRGKILPFHRAAEGRC
jgi:hypothetical protein